jgi:hypothetical protein
VQAVGAPPRFTAWIELSVYHAWSNRIPEVITMNGRSASLLIGEHRPRLGIAALLLVALLAGAGDAASQTPSFTPLQISVLPVAQIFREDLPVRGIRLNLVYGRQQWVTGLDAGFFNEVRQDMSGLGVGIVNLSYGDASGVQLALTNSVDGRFRGLQTALANVNEGDLSGIQLGGLNVTEDGSGMQLGLWNRASSLKGVQLGLININANGFLPFFPFINFGF